MNMTLLPGHEDLKPRKVANLVLFVEEGDKIKRYQVFIGPGGGLSAAPFKQEDAPIDQLTPREKTPVAHRWAGTDQAGTV